MSDIAIARQIAGTQYDDMADRDVLGTVEAIEKTMGRALLGSEAQFLRAALDNRRARLLREADKAPAFVPEMYADTRSAAERRLDDPSSEE